MVKTAISGVLLGLLGLAPNAVAAAYDLTFFRFPGSSETTAVDINDAGQIVGNYTDATGLHGYIGRPGAFTSFDRVIAGINNLGQIVGPTDNPIEFYVSSGGTVSTYVVPGVDKGFSIDVGDINDHGQVAGYQSNFDGSAVFISTAGVVSTTLYPNSLGRFYAVEGIDNAGEIGGNAFDRGPDYETNGFVGQPGAFQLVPGPAGSSSPHFGKLSSDGALIGVAFQSVSFITNRPIPFLYQDGVSTLLDLGLGTLPYRGDIELNSVNTRGEVVGTLFSNGTYRSGFLATPVTDVAEPASLGLLMGVLAFLGASRQRARPRRLKMQAALLAVAAACCSSSVARATALMGTFTGKGSNSFIGMYPGTSTSNLDGVDITGAFAFIGNGSFLVQSTSSGYNAYLFGETKLTFNVLGSSVAGTYGYDSVLLGVRLTSGSLGQGVQFYSQQIAGDDYTDSGLFFAGTGFFDPADPLSLHPGTIDYAASTSHYAFGSRFEFGTGIQLTSVTFGTPVPEPGTITITMTGIAALVGLRVLRRRAA